MKKISTAIRNNRIKTILILGLVVSGVSGIAFGIYPAYQAGKKNPIDALRYE